MIELTEDLFIGKGSHKKCYRYPNDLSKCVKVAYSKDGKKDLEREIKYLKVLKRKNKDYSCLPKYYGPIETSLGKGYLFEFIKNYDNSLCMPLETYLKNDELLENEFNLKFNELVNACKEIKQTLLNNEILTMGLFAINFLIEDQEDNSIKLRVINDMGSASLFPVEYYISYFAKKRITKRWNRFIEHLEKNYKTPKAQEFINAIR